MELSFKQYRNIDLAILLAVYAIGEVLTVRAARYWFPGELYSLSPTVAMLCIIMMRWGGYAVIHALAGGAILCLAMGAKPEQFVIYCIGNCLALTGLLWFKGLGKERIRQNAWLTAVYTVTVFCAVQIGRWLVGLFFGGGIGSIAGFFAYDSMSLVFAIFVVQITRRLDGVFEDQKTYLLRTQKELRKQELQD